MSKLDSNYSSSQAAPAQMGGGRLFVVSAPSGTGKTTITARLQQMNLAQVSISHTTRPPRPGEIYGEQYFFIGRDKFIQMRDAGAFIESAEVFGQFYGTAKEWVKTQLQQGRNVLLEIDVQGALHIQKAMPDAVLIFIRPPSLESLITRLKQRNQDSPDAILRRLAEAEKEISHAKAYNYVIINDVLERAIAEIRNIIVGGDGGDKN